MPEISQDIKKGVRSSTASVSISNSTNNCGKICSSLLLVLLIALVTLFSCTRRLVVLSVMKTVGQCNSDTVNLGLHNGKNTSSRRS